MDVEAQFQDIGDLRMEVRLVGTVREFKIWRTHLDMKFHQMSNQVVGAIAKAIELAESKTQKVAVQKDLEDCVRLEERDGKGES